MKAGSLNFPCRTRIQVLTPFGSRLAWLWGWLLDSWWVSPQIDIPSLTPWVEVLPSRQRNLKSFPPAPQGEYQILSSQSPPLFRVEDHHFWHQHIATVFINLTGCPYWDIIMCQAPPQGSWDISGDMTYRDRCLLGVGFQWQGEGGGGREIDNKQ